MPQCDQLLPPLQVLHDRLTRVEKMSSFHGRRDPAIARSKGFELHPSADSKGSLCVSYPVIQIDIDQHVGSICAPIRPTGCTHYERSYRDFD
jgi:hypothetical protein